MFQGTGKLFQDEGSDISYDDYGQGFTLSDESGDAAYAQLIKHGTLRLEIRFAQALADTINVIAHTEFQNLLEVDKHRNILVDFSS